MHILLHCCKMVIRKISNDVQSLLSASNQINNINKAIEELVYNALDADATSIAIRVNIQENAIQVIDNGCGVCDNDFKYVGQKYMTSKLIDLSTLESAPHKYGFRGQALANLINVSKNVRLISRQEKSERTWMKLFKHGKERQIKEWTLRPSKGTTVEINGFLYNVSMRKKSNNILCEIQCIKTFLEHLSLVHSNISLSLRDDSKNEIIFKMHKNRDMYQTLSTLYNIDKEDVQELKVEKNEYKVTAFIGKTDKEIGRHLISLNGKFISSSSKLHKIVKVHLTKNFKYRGTKSPKAKNIHRDECDLFQTKTPFYFVFIKCPYMDYELSNSPKQSVLEFKDWNQVKALLEKLIKFYNGDMNLKEINKVDINKANHEAETSDTRKRVKKIMEKFLGSHCKKPAISQMHKGIKGKEVKRKMKMPLEKSLKWIKCMENCNKSSNFDVNSKTIIKDVADDWKTDKAKREPKVKMNQQEQTNHISGEAINKDVTDDCKIEKAKRKINLQMDQKQQISIINGKATNKQVPNDCELNKAKCRQKLKMNPQQPTSIFKRKEDNATSAKKQTTKKYSKANRTKPCLGTLIGNAYNCNFKKVSNHNKIIFNKTENKLNINKTKKYPINCNNIIKKFEMETDSVKNRCTELDKKIKRIQNQRNNRKCKVFVTENVQYNNITKNNINYTLRKQIEEIVFHDYFPRAPQSNLPDDNNVNNHVKRKAFQSNYDLIQTILKSQQDKKFERQVVEEHPVAIRNQPQPRNTTVVKNHCPVNTATDTNPTEPITSFYSRNSYEPIVSYQSHNYYAHRNVNGMQHNNQNSYHKEQMVYNDYEIFNKKPRTFITKQFRENLVIPKTSNKRNIFKKKNNANGCTNQLKSNIKKLFHQTSKLFNLKNQILGNTGESSYTIEFTNGNYKATDNEVSKLEACSHIKNPSVFIEDSSPQSINNDYYVSNEINNNRISINTDTYTLTYIKDNNGYFTNLNDCNLYSTYTIEQSNESIDVKIPDNEIVLDDKRNFIFVSKSQEHVQKEQILDPRTVCETILHSQDILQGESEFSFSNRRNNLFNNVDTDLLIQNRTDNQKGFNEFHADENEPSQDVFEDQNSNRNENLHAQDVSKEVSHHFSIPINSFELNEQSNQNPILITRGDNILQKNAVQNACEIQNDYENNDNNRKYVYLDDFNLKNRLCFLPKGMSPIFNNCYTKNICEYNLSEDYYGDEMYNNFADNVRNNAEIFEPKIQEAKEVTTKAIDKFNAKISKDNATLKFNGQSLKATQVLGQIDEKFIAAIIKGWNNTEEISHFLVLFDQHAVHERIRLENNLADYFIENQWKPVNIDEVTLKLSNEHILYLHNYKDKFSQLGLQWSVLNSEDVSFTAIPEAILGKNPRQVDKVIKALKSLITEEINIIRTQGGCVSLYPKSIMELVFSEACRYAIKFGDKLCKSECVELLKNLSSCKTPFQCAHGRPVMAVIMDIHLNKIDYEVNLDKVAKWKANN